jgi:hypothetical protein
MTISFTGAAGTAPQEAIVLTCSTAVELAKKPATSTVITATGVSSADPTQSKLAPFSLTSKSVLLANSASGSSDPFEFNDLALTFVILLGAAGTLAVGLIAAVVVLIVFLVKAKGGADGEEGGDDGDDKKSEVVDGKTVEMVENPSKVLVKDDKESETIAPAAAASTKESKTSEPTKASTKESKASEPTKAAAATVDDAEAERSKKRAERRERTKERRAKKKAAAEAKRLADEMSTVAG